MIDGSEKRNRQLAFELQNSHVCEKRSDMLLTSEQTTNAGSRDQHTQHTCIRTLCWVREPLSQGGGPEGDSPEMRFLCSYAHTHAPCLLFLVTRQVHSYGTRRSELFYLPQCRTNIRKFSISFQGPKFFNSLSFEIRNAISTASFCCKLKAFLLS